MFLTRLLQLMSEREASDLFIAAGGRRHVQINNNTLPVSTQITDAPTAPGTKHEVMDADESALRGYLRSVLGVDAKYA